MLNPSKKRKFFVFTASLLITVFVGYFSWSAIASVGGDFVNKILSYTDKIGAKIFTASILLNNNQLTNLTLVPTEEATGDLAESEDFKETEEFNQPVLQEKSTQDILDDIQEKLDIISQQVQELVGSPQDETEEDKVEEEEKDDLNQIVYPKILISEVQILPIEQRFIKLYNPNNLPVDLTGWYLQRKTETADSWSSCVSSVNFEGKTILPGGYFLISRTDNLANIVLNSLTLTENNSLVLKDPNGEISDIAYTVSPIPDQPSNGGGGGSAPVCETFNNILISEFQVEGETVDDDWVELYNPNDAAACLEGWSIQKASSTGSVARVKNFANGSLISAKGYFLVANNNASQSILNLADMTASGLKLSSEFAGGNTIYLVGKKDEILEGGDPDIIDKVGYGMARDYENLPALMPNEKNRSTGRIWNEDEQTYFDTDDNSADFEIDTPTPKAQNEKYIEPVPSDIIAPVITLIGDLEVTITVGDTYADMGATALDETDGYIAADIVVVNSVDVNIVGDYIITYNVSDVAGNNAVEVTRFIHVVAIVPPPPPPTDITPPTGTIIINDGALYTNSRDVVLTISATDDLSEVTEMKIANASSYHDWESYAVSKQWVLPSTNGVKTVRIKFKDFVGNETATGIPTTIILDTVAPVITLNGDSTINLDVGGTYQEFSATITDINPGSLVIGGDAVDTAIPATFYVTYDTFDLAENSATQVIRTVIVNEIEN